MSQSLMVVELPVCTAGFLAALGWFWKSLSSGQREVKLSIINLQQQYAVSDAKTIIRDKDIVDLQKRVAADHDALVEVVALVDRHEKWHDTQEHK